MRSKKNEKKSTLEVLKLSVFQLIVMCTPQVTPYFGQEVL